MIVPLYKPVYVYCMYCQTASTPSPKHRGLTLREVGLGQYFPLARYRVAGWKRSLYRNTRGVAPFRAP